MAESATQTAQTAQEVQEVTMYPSGAFCWGDLLTPDSAEAKRFYSALFGWTFEDVPLDAGPVYTFAFHSGKPVVGLMSIPGIQAVWQSYVSVDDAAEAADAVRAAGGTVTDGPVDVGGTGRMVTFLDPSGHALGVWQPQTFSGAGADQGPAVPVWRELWTDDVGPALEFYTRLFGWRGGLQQSGDTTYAACHNGETPVTVLMPNSAAPGEPHAGWVTYFGSADVPAVAAQVQALGGTVTYGPTVMSGYPFAACRDPQGAVFLLMGAPQAA